MDSALNSCWLFTNKIIVWFGDELLHSRLSYGQSYLGSKCNGSKYLNLSQIACEISSGQALKVSRFEESRTSIFLPMATLSYMLLDTTFNDNVCRYCCNSNKMYRPMPVSMFEALIPPVWILGPMVTTVKVEGSKLKNLKIMLCCCHGNNKPGSLDLK